MHRVARHLLWPLQAWAIAATAQDLPKAPDGPDIVVTAAKPIDDQVRDFVDALTQGPQNGQLSRFETRAACPATLGMPAAQGQRVVARMRRVAAAAGVPVAAAKCDANILVVVTPNKKTFIESLARKYPVYLGKLSKREIQALADLPGPAAAWQLAGPQLNADGVEMAGDPTTGTYVNRTGRAASRMSFGARPHFAGAMVVVEGDALVGLTTTQLADYVAMRAFARTDPAKLKGSNAPTILKLLDAAPDSDVPVTLTEWDLGFLRGLYASPVNLRAAQQRSAIGSELKNDLKSAGSRGNASPRAQ